MRNRFLSSGREAMIKGADTNQQSLSGKECLPGGITVVILGKARALLKGEVAKGPLGDLMT